MSSKLKKAIGAVKDQTSISLAKVSGNTSSNLEVAVLKATSHDAEPIDDRYVFEILHLVSSNKANAAACARAIGKRIGRTRNWVVALKSLMLVLRVFQDGDPYFPREVLHAMKRGAKILNLSGFRDDSNSSPWDFTSFVRTVALYLDERLECFLTGKLQRRYTHKGSASAYKLCKNRSARRPSEPVRDMKPVMLLDKMSYWQRLLDRAIATRPTGAAKTNHLVLISLYAIVQESFDLYKNISDALARVLDSFYHLQYQNCISAFQICLKAAKQFEELSAFYAMCKNIGVGKSSEYPSVQAISEELIETLQEFLKDQSPFSSSAKPTNQLALAPATPLKVRPSASQSDRNSVQSELSPMTDKLSDRASEFGSQWTSLEDLIKATETGRTPAISIDLEAYSESQVEDMGVSETGSTRSLPVSYSIGDLMSLEDWTGQDEKEDQDQQQDHQQEHKQNGFLDSSALTSWEIVLAETVSTSSSEAAAALPQPLAYNNANTFNAFPEQPPTADETPSTSANTSNNDWRLALFEAAPAQEPTPNTQTPPNNHYNPFLQDPIDLLETLKNKSLTPPPTFQATPTFSTQNPYQKSSAEQNENDPFAEFSDGQKQSNPTDQHNFLLEQQLWLENQNKIIAKQMDLGYGTERRQ